MKKICKKLLMIAFVVIMIVAEPISISQYNTTIAKAEKIKSTDNKVTVTLGKNITLELEGVKKKDYPRVEWKSSNVKVATISQKGKVTTLREGVAIITAVIDSKNFQCEVTVERDDSVYTIDFILLGEGLDYYFDQKDVTPSEKFGKFPKPPKKDSKGRKFQYWFIINSDRSISIVTEDSIVKEGDNFYKVYAKYEY